MDAAVPAGGDTAAAGRGRRTRRAARVTGIVADEATAAAFAAVWARGTGREPVVTMRQLLYRLAGLTPPAVPPPGRARTAAAGDRVLLAGWYEEFCADAREPARTDPDAWAEHRIRTGA